VTIDINVENKIKNGDLAEAIMIAKRRASRVYNLDPERVTADDVYSYLKEFSDESFIDINLI
jgi:hypothetical protein